MIFNEFVRSSCSIKSPNNGYCAIEFSLFIQIMQKNCSPQLGRPFFFVVNMKFTNWTVVAIGKAWQMCRTKGIIVFLIDKFNTLKASHFLLHYTPYGLLCLHSRSQETMMDLVLKRKTFCTECMLSTLWDSLKFPIESHNFLSVSMVCWRVSKKTYVL